MSFMNGLSAAGAGIANYAASAGLMTQKADLEQQQATLADQLATARETKLQGQQQAFQTGLQGQAQAFQGAQTEKEIAARAALNASTIAAENQRQQNLLNQPPETIRVLKALGVQLPGTTAAADTSTGSAAAGGASGAPSGATVPSDPMANPLVRKAMGMPLSGSPEASRMAIADDVESDPAFKGKTAGQKAAEIESRVAVAEGKMTDPESRAGMAKAIASYQIAPLSTYALVKPGGPETMGLVMQLNPDYQESRYPEINKAMSAFGTGKQGDIIRSLNVGVQHLDLIDEAAKNLGNTSVQAVNALKNAFQQQFGSPAPTTFDGLKQIVATEVEKSVAGGIGSAADRDRLLAAMNRASSPAQLQAMTDGFRGLMIGQLAGLKTQYEEATGIKSGPFAFESKLVPATIQRLSGRPGSDAASTLAAPTDSNIIRYDARGNRITP